TIARRPPRRSQPDEQCPGERADALQALPRQLALDAAQAWASYQRTKASGYLDGSARRLALGALGDGVVPQVVEAIGRGILALDAVEEDGCRPQHGATTMQPGSVSRQ